MRKHDAVICTLKLLPRPTDNVLVLTEPVVTGNTVATLLGVSGNLAFTPNSPTGLTIQLPLLNAATLPSTGAVIGVTHRGVTCAAVAWTVQLQNVQ